MKNNCCSRENAHEHWPTADSLLAVHPVQQCSQDNIPCSIHSPSDHSMKDWPQHWRFDRGIMERICSHGVGHPDPDELRGDSVHGCDGCCSETGYLG